LPILQRLNLTGELVTIVHDHDVILSFSERGTGPKHHQCQWGYVFDHTKTCAPYLLHHFKALLSPCRQRLNWSCNYSGCEIAIPVAGLHLLERDPQPPYMMRVTTGY